MIDPINALLAIAFVVLTALCFGAADRRRARRERSDNRLAELGRVLHDTEEDHNQ